METTKTKKEIIIELQKIAEEVEKYKKEVETLLNIIDGLEKQYYDLAITIKTAN